MMRLISVALLVVIAASALAQQGGNGADTASARPIPPRSNTVQQEEGRMAGNGGTDLGYFYLGQDLILVEDHWAALEMRGDALFLEELLSGRFHFTDTDGKRLDRAGYLRGFLDRTLTVESLKKTEMDVEHFGPLAVVTGVGTIKATRAGSPIQMRFRFIDMFVEEETVYGSVGLKRWRPIASQRTAIEALDKRPTPDNVPSEPVVAR